MHSAAASAAVGVMWACNGWSMRAYAWLLGSFALISQMTRCPAPQETSSRLCKDTHTYTHTNNSMALTLIFASCTVGMNVYSRWLWAQVQHFPIMPTYIRVNMTACERQYGQFTTRQNNHCPCLQRNHGELVKRQSIKEKRDHSPKVQSVINNTPVSVLLKDRTLASK